MSPRIRRAAAVFLLAAAVVACDSAPDEPTETELARLVQRARPVWENYGEDIKAELGATPVARWSGRLVEARVEGNRVTLTFDVGPPWRDYAFGIPVLVRDPLGAVHRASSYRAGAYEFVLGGFAPGAVIPWIEIQFPPYEERRIAFDSTGAWRDAPAR